MSFLWATRGLTWGFRFLRDEGLVDPLPVYDRAFADASGDPAIWQAPGAAGEPGALRFPDPLGRRDRAGRVIPHEFVIFPPLSRTIDSVESGVVLIWPLVAEEFARVWELPHPSSAE